MVSVYNTTTLISLSLLETFEILKKDKPQQGAGIKCETQGEKICTCHYKVYNTCICSLICTGFSVHTTLTKHTSFKNPSSPHSSFHNIVRSQPYYVKCLKLWILWFGTTWKWHICVRLSCFLQKWKNKVSQTKPTSLLCLHLHKSVGFVVTSKELYFKAENRNIFT